MYTHFKNILGNEPCELSEEVKSLIDNINIDNLNIEDLDCEFTESEITDMLKSLKRGKSTGSDQLSGEMFLEDIGFFAPILTNLFNKLFERNIYP